MVGIMAALIVLGLMWLDIMGELGLSVKGSEPCFLDLSSSGLTIHLSVR